MSSTIGKELQLQYPSSSFLALRILPDVSSQLRKFPSVDESRQARSLGPCPAWGNELTGLSAPHPHGT